jgi:hypothetical protein
MMSTDNFYVQLPSIKDHFCTQYIIDSLAQKNEGADFGRSISKIALVALAEVASVFDLIAEQFIFSHLVLSKLWEFSLPSLEDVENYFQKTLAIGLFFFSFIPYLIERKFDLKEFQQPSLEEIDFLAQIRTLQREVLELAPFREKIEGITAEIKAIIANKEHFLSPAIRYEEKFRTEIPNTDGLTRALNRYIFLTNEKNHALLMLEPLSLEEQRDCQEIHIYFRTLSQLTRKFEYVFDSSDILEVTNLFKGEFYDLESMVGFSKTDKLQAKIFFTLAKLFQVYMKNPELPSAGLFVSTMTLAMAKRHDLYSYLMQRVIVLFDLYLEENHPDILAHTIRPMQITQQMLKDHFAFMGTMAEFHEIYKLFSSSIARRDCPRVNAANHCILRSIDRALKA